jgi:hypothetical protein
MFHPNKSTGHRNLSFSPLLLSFHLPPSPTPYRMKFPVYVLTYAKNRENWNPEERQNLIIESVADLVLLNLFMNGSGKCNRPHRLKLNMKKIEIFADVFTSLICNYAIANINSTKQIQNFPRLERCQ